MALTRQKKIEIIAEVSELLQSSKLTVIAKYEGTSVQAMQTLRKSGKESETKLRVVKNRLIKQALLATDNLKEVDTSELHGQLLYAFNASDEAAPAQVLAAFAKTEPQVTFVGAINAEGQFMSAVDVASLASLPGKEQLRAMLAGTIAAPLSGFMNVMSGNVRGILGALNARAQQIS